MARALMIDCDPGADDAIALMIALASPAQLAILGITTVAGNVPLVLTQTNARKICERVGHSEMRVFAGCSRPLVKALHTAEEVHGKTGIDGVTLPDPVMPLQTQHAVDFLVETCVNASEKLTIATLGPLTNMAMALVKHPQIAEKIDEIVIMGGAITHGNITPSAEFNFYVDPHAAHVVLTSGVPITLISLDVTHQAIATPERLDYLRSLPSVAAQTAVGLLDHYGQFDKRRHGFSGPPIHDACVIAYLLQPELFRCRPAYVEMELSGGAIGRTIVDVWNVAGQPPNVNLATHIDADGFFRLLFTLLNDRLQ